MNKKEKIKITCYGETTEWDCRAKAEAFFLRAIQCSDGSERNRYMNIYCQLQEGCTVCSDEEEY